MPYGVILTRKARKLGRSRIALRTKNTDELKRAKLRVFLPKGEFRVAPETGTPPSIASNRDFGLGGVSVSSVSKHKKLGPPEFQNLISCFTDSDGVSRVTLGRPTRTCRACDAIWRKGAQADTCADGVWG